MDAILNAYITKNKLGIHQSLLEIEMPESQITEIQTQQKKVCGFEKHTLLASLNH